MRKKNEYREAIQALRRYQEEKPHLTRANRYQIIQDMTGIDKETVELITRWDRAIREVFPKDEVGAKLEREWKMPDYMRQPDLSWTDIFKRDGLNN